MTKYTFKITTQYMEEYNHDAENWSESFYKWKFGNTYIIHGFNQDATAVAFVLKELCGDNEFVKTWEEVSINHNLQKAENDWTDYWDKETPRIYIDKWVTLSDDMKNIYVQTGHPKYKHITGEDFREHIIRFDVLNAKGVLDANIA